jgi:hypothetical protein
MMVLVALGCQTSLPCSGQHVSPRGNGMAVGIGDSSGVAMRMCDGEDGGGSGEERQTQ